MKDKARSLDSLQYCHAATSLVNLTSSYTRLAVNQPTGTDSHADSIGPDSFRPLLPSDAPSQIDIRQLSGSLTGNGHALVKDNSEHDCGRHRAKVGNTNRRERWRNRTEFLLTLIGYTVGLGNVWRFPSLCHKNGGASFLIPYGIMLAVEGIPLYYMELCIGQKMRKGAVGVWNDISPYLGGVGIASAVVCFLVSLYYNVIIAWCVFYFVTSFQSDLPWSKCPTEEVTLGNVTRVQPVRECSLTRPTAYFWYRTTLQTSSGIEDGGGMNWKLFACLACTWFLVWLCMMKGIKVTGKIVYITALLPIVILIIFFFRGVHLDGYQDGLALLFVPDFERLKDPMVWLDAAVQIFYSLGVAYGSLIAFSSYNPIKNDSTRDAITVCLINCATSIYASVVVFCFIGFQAENMMKDCLSAREAQFTRLINMTGAISDQVNKDTYEALLENATKFANESLPVCNKSDFLVMPSGQGLAFLTFTDAINKMPLGPLWSVVFFLMLITIGIDTEFGMLEGVVTPLIDMNLTPKWTKEKISGMICLVSFLMGIPLVQSSGEYWVQLYDNYCSGIPLLTIALVECLAISYTYGIDRFSKDIKYMTNKPPRFIWKWCWKMISPLAILAVLCMSIKGMSERTPTYGVWDRNTGKVVYVPYPPWAKFLAFLLIFISIFFIPAVAILRYFRIISMPGENKAKDEPLNNFREPTDSTELQPLYTDKDEDQMNKESRFNFRDRKETNVAEHEKRLARLNGQANHVIPQVNGRSQFV